MKKHAIIPIFIPHKGCPNDCVFCNQRRITARDGDITTSDIRKIADTWLETLENVETVEMAFFGGSFTGLPMEEQSEYLSVAKEYKDMGKIDKIHLSTRPDYIDDEILENLKSHGVDVIELGVQSFDPKVLAASKRGHRVEDVYSACKKIKYWKFSLGIQLMIGLPGDSLEADIFSAKEAVALNPETARLYPTVVIENTELYDMTLAGTYKMLDEDDAVFRTKEMYKILSSAGINIIRVGLKSSDLIGPSNSFTGATFHPAFRQLVEGDLAREIIENELKPYVNETLSHEKKKSQGNGTVTCYSSPRDFSNMIGNSKRNKIYFNNKYPNLKFIYKIDSELKRNQYRIDF